MFVKAKIVGKPPGMLFCNPRAANRRDSFAAAVEEAQKANKKHKTVEAFDHLMNVQWHCHQYWSPNVGCYIPRRMIQAALILASKKEKKGMTNYREIVACSVSPLCDAVLELPVKHNTEADIKRMASNDEYVFIIPAKINNSLVPVSRPLFQDWKATLEFEIVDEDAIPISLFKTFLGHMGRAGFGDWRPSAKSPGEYGAYDIVSVETSSNRKNWSKA